MTVWVDLQTEKTPSVWFPLRDTRKRKNCRDRRGLWRAGRQTARGTFREMRLVLTAVLMATHLCLCPKQWTILITHDETPACAGQINHLYSREDDDEVTESKHSSVHPVQTQSNPLQSLHTFIASHSCHHKKFLTVLKTALLSSTLVLLPDTREQSKAFPAVTEMQLPTRS